MKRFYLSFANEKFLGAVCTVAWTPEEALKKVSSLGLNPGGEVLILEGWPDCALGRCDTLLRTKEEIEEVFQSPVTRTADASPEDKELLDKFGTVVCDHCNKPTRN
jgi:hypothetical protein